MTIGIAASGANAGLAVFRALAAVERVAQGAIGGFAAFAAVDASGAVYRAETQRGGTRTLFTAGETTGVPPPSMAASATRAGIMSSGPDRPAPLAQFVPADAAAGLVTGHRLPNAAGLSGQPVNLAVLDRLRAGETARTAVAEVLDADPEADAGVIAIDQYGGIFSRNSRRVGQRPDLGHARREHGTSGAVVEVLHNAIFPADSLAALAADIALAVMAPTVSAGRITVAAGVPVIPGAADQVLVDAAGNAFRIETTDQRIVRGRHNCAAIYLGSLVIQSGRALGRTAFEPNVVVADGHIVSLSGQTRLELDYCAPEQPCMPDRP